MIGGLVEQIRLVPEGGNVRIEVRGKLGTILRLAEEARNTKGVDLSVSALAEQIKLDAGTRKHLDLIPT